MRMRYSVIALASLALMVGATARADEASAKKNGLTQNFNHPPSVNLSS